MKDIAGNYYLVPDPDGTAATVYHLGAAGACCGNSVVLIPYSNPYGKKPEAKYFPIQTVSCIALNGPAPINNPLVLRARTSKAEYLKKLRGLKEHIQQGNIYEINFCVEFFCEGAEIDPYNTFIHLYQLTKAPYSALLKTGDEFILCGSPELFLKKEGGFVSSKPIKGTIRRGVDAQEDEALKTTLYNSLKERTENVMAVDVARNDLSHFAKKSSVRVNKLYNIETFETVHQMVSTVSCEIKEGTGFEKIINATFPMASMTGAPKIRAMQLIDELEDFERKNYSGAMGIINANEDFKLSVIIRSIFYNQKTKQLSIAVGGAITYLSEPEKEYEECLLKARAMLKALNATIV